MKPYRHKIADIANNNQEAKVARGWTTMDKNPYNKIALTLLNNKVLADGLIDEEAKRNIDRQIETMQISDL